MTTCVRALVNIVFSDGTINDGELACITHANNLNKQTNVTLFQFNCVNTGGLTNCSSRNLVAQLARALTPGMCRAQPHRFGFYPILSLVSLIL